MLAAGHIIYVTTQRSDGKCGYLQADGFVDSRCGIRWVEENEEPCDFARCLFRVYPKLSYAAKRQLAKLEDLPTSQVLDLTAFEAARQRQREKAAREMHHNAERVVQAVASEEPVLYGQTLLLQHVRSNKFVMFDKRVLADMDQSCIKVALAHEEFVQEGSFFNVKVTP
jgi:hypothetical protein